MYSTRIYYQDTDAGGVVYFANYLKFVEKSWFEHLLSIGISIPEWEASDTYIIVKNVSLDLIEPLRYADQISVKTTTSGVKHTYFFLSHTIMKGEKKVTSCETRMVCVNRSGRPKRIPEELRDRLIQDIKNG